MDWIQADIYTTTEGIEPVCGRLMQIGITGFVIRDPNDFREFLENKDGNWDYIDKDLMGLANCETTVTCYLTNDPDGFEKLKELRAQMEDLAAIDDDLRFGRLYTELMNVREEDWANNWKQYFRPFLVGSRLAVKPSWETYANPEGRTVLEIDPESSFGTGQHHTTRLCLEMLETQVKGGERILDLGCGSGILSIAGMLLGAGSAYAVDIDPNSVRIASQNAVKNHITSGYVTDVGNITSDEELCARIGTGYDIITANIVADVLIAMSGYFGRFLSADGVIIISGIILERCDEVMEAMDKAGFHRIAMRTANGWAAAAYRFRNEQNN
ncbi:MAG: 50S ribosomal protein L11 methyltransferase [Oscillospiraceae bacterium]|nr:50S ribosomal protein L11 methyltransferase [Oscillospiraceae bacterium]MBQ8979727.1 50S ribosomal protein L11 methyltransferase [Oscillospiraceae bacterium]